MLLLMMNVVVVGYDIIFVVAVVVVLKNVLAVQRAIQIIGTLASQLGKNLKYLHLIHVVYS